LSFWHKQLKPCQLYTIYHFLRNDIEKVFVMTILRNIGLTARIAIARKTVIITWQSWELQPVSVMSFNETNDRMLDENPVGTFSPRKHLQIANLSCCVKLKLAGGRYCLPLRRGCGWSSCLIFRSTTSLRDFSPSFTFPVKPKNPIVLSNTFLWRCIPSMAWRTVKSSHYGKYLKKYRHLLERHINVFCSFSLLPSPFW
jgi:hypothetical protein